MVKSNAQQGATAPKWYAKRKPRPTEAERGFTAHDGRKSE